MNKITLLLCVVFTLSLTWSQSNGSTSSAALRSRRSTVSQFTNTFLGCFMPNKARDLHAHRWNKNNLNIRCIGHCRDRSYPIAVTNGDLCACSNSLLGITPRVTLPHDRNNSDSGGKCNQRCPGTAGSGSCSFDTCCGGIHEGRMAYSVFVVGNIKSVKTVLTRAQAALKKNNYNRLKELFGRDNPDFTKKPNTRLLIQGFNHRTNQFVESSAEKCWDRCKADSGCQGSTWSGNSIDDAKNNCYLFPSTFPRMPYLFKPYMSEVRSDGWTTYLKGKEEEWEDSKRRRLYNHYASFYGGFDALQCRQKCLDRRDTCGGAMIVHKRECRKMENVDSRGGCCFLYKYGEFRNTSDNWGFASFVFKKPIVEVEATATSLNAKGETTGKKKCIIASSYSCSASADINPATMILEVQDMQRMLVHQLGKNLQPLGKFDLEKDNTGGTQPATVTKIFTVSESSERSWSTESGVETSYTVGNSFSATAGVSAFGFSASLTSEFSTEMTSGGFFNSGFSKTTSKTIKDEIRVAYEVPAGQKLLINFFKETYPLSIRWRALMVATGTLKVTFLGKTKILFVSEILNLKERTIYAFGKIDFGDREKIVSMAKFIDASGDILSLERSD